MIDYEKKYNEALSTAKKLYNEAKSNEYTSDMEDYERIFPELRESDDERIRMAIGAAICGATAEKVLEANGTNLPDALAYLEKKKEQKPVEWSEKDEVMLKEIILFFKDGSVKLQHDLDLYAGFLEKRLKSLRPQPHWKPSEEQMVALLNAEGLMRANNYPEKAKILAELYEQLKKLM